MVGCGKLIYSKRAAVINFKNFDEIELLYRIYVINVAINCGFIFLLAILERRKMQLDIKILIEEVGKIF